MNFCENVIPLASKGWLTPLVITALWQRQKDLVFESSFLKFGKNDKLRFNY